MVKFLIIRFSSIGDIVLTTPVIRALKQQVEDAEVHFLVKKQFFTVVANNPYIDKIHVFDYNFKEILSELKNELFDYVIDLHNNLRTLRFKNSLSVIDFSFKKLNWQKWLLVNFGINRLPDKHIVERYLDTLSSFDVTYDGKGLDYFIPAADEVNLNIFPEIFQKGYIGFAIGAQHYTKKLPKEKIASICRKINKPIILLGGKDDADVAEYILNNSSSLVFNACGKFNLNQSASIVRQARCIITHDTGLMHIAAAFYKKIISVWGNTIPEFGMYPFDTDKESKIMEVKTLKCRPCTKIGFRMCPKKHFRCMNNIDENQIVSIIESWWQ